MKRVKITNPAVINTTLSPLTESFRIEGNATYQQWYYNIDGTFKPDRQITPLLLFPRISVYDPESRQAYTPLIVQPTEWAYRQGSNDTWHTIEVTESSENASTADYVMRSDFSLLVRKNAPSQSPVDIRCTLWYEDPRLPGQLYSVTPDDVTLATNTDTSVLYPDILLDCPPMRRFNVIDDSVYDGTAKMLKGLMTFQCRAVKNLTDVSSGTYFVWYIRENGTEVLAESHPCYVSGQNTQTLTVDVMYSEYITVVCRGKQSSTSTVFFPSQAVSGVSWEIPNVDAITRPLNGTTVDSVNRQIFFDTILNMKRGNKISILDDDTKRAHFLFNWKRRKANSSVKTDCGWGSEIRIPSSDMLDYNKIGSQVFADVYLKGAYEALTQNGAVVTQNGETVYERK
ncbi:hypothetical protein [Prevotella sp. tf2-5]|uniref:hypothetical protein n=1 Tax=Prevotella sp. tf2-5 TaxID=1761889 RepID=UPI0008E3A9C0|nr:hypothetical protein [Prevotella sp. tf2-5]SFO61826.1 hypothetical protein SAMN04487852_103277 [Prevotella sp. tf2-5]